MRLFFLLRASEVSRLGRRIVQKGSKRPAAVKTRTLRAHEGFGTHASFNRALAKSGAARVRFID